jgi:hypothetical protein
MVNRICSCASEKYVLTADRMMDDLNQISQLTGVVFKQQADAIEAINTELIN